MFFFPASESSLCDVTYVDIVPIITLNVARHSNPRGTGFWKLNTSHLSEMRYVQEIKTQLKALWTWTIAKTAPRWAQLCFLEMIKLKVREKTTSYAAYKNVATEKREEITVRARSCFVKNI